MRSVGFSMKLNWFAWSGVVASISAALACAYLLYMIVSAEIILP
jgi:hypothetical protein